MEGFASGDPLIASEANGAHQSVADRDSPTSRRRRPAIRENLAQERRRVRSTNISQAQTAKQIRPSQANPVADRNLDQPTTPPRRTNPSPRHPAMAEHGPRDLRERINLKHLDLVIDPDRDSIGTALPTPLSKPFPTLQPDRLIRRIDIPLHKTVNPSP
jgi:hypothetical protein